MPAPTGDICVIFIDYFECVGLKFVLVTSGDISFEYSLDGEDFTPGQLVFTFEVSELDSDIVHTAQSVTYMLDQQLVALNIEVNGETNKPSVRYLFSF